MQNVNIRMDARTDGQSDEWMERQKLYIPRYTSYAGGIISKSGGMLQLNLTLGYMWHHSKYQLNPGVNIAQVHAIAEKHS